MAMGKSAHAVLSTMWISICVVLLSAEPEISVSGPVGSTAVLTCELMRLDTDVQNITWWIRSKIVFERLGEARYEAGGYEGRVDVPVEELRKGNCSLVLHNLTFTDTGVYTSCVFLPTRSLCPKTISRVNLSVCDRGSILQTPQGDAVMKSPSLIPVLSLVSCLLVQLFCGGTI